MGDYVKGPLKGHNPPPVEAGIRLHRQIDQFSHQHPLAQLINERLPPIYRRYSGILQDMVSDHFLSLNWSQYSSEELPAFASHTYAMLADHRHIMPAAAAGFSERLEHYDLLCLYRDWATIERSLANIGSRLPRANPLGEAGAQLANHLPEMESVFHQHYPAMVEFARRQRAQLLAEIED